MLEQNIKRNTLYNLTYDRFVINTIILKLNLCFVAVITSVFVPQVKRIGRQVCEDYCEYNLCTEVHSITSFQMCPLPS